MKKEIREEIIKAWAIMKYDLFQRVVPTEHSAKLFISGREKEYKYVPCIITINPLNQ